MWGEVRLNFVQLGSRGALWALSALRYRWDSMKLGFIEMNGIHWNLDSLKWMGFIESWEGWRILGYVGIRNPRFLLSAPLLSLGWRFKVGGALPSPVCLPFAQKSRRFIWSQTLPNICIPDGTLNATCQKPPSIHSWSKGGQLQACRIHALVFQC